MNTSVFRIPVFLHSAAHSFKKKCGHPSPRTAWCFFSFLFFWSMTNIAVLSVAHGDNNGSQVKLQSPPADITFSSLFFLLQTRIGDNTAGSTAGPVQSTIPLTLDRFWLRQQTNAALTMHFSVPGLCPHVTTAMFSDALQHACFLS